MTPAEISRTRQSQGLPATISDPGALAKIAALLALPMSNDAPEEGSRKAERRRRAERRRYGGAS